LKRFRTLLKWTLFAVVLAYVCRHGYSLWQKSDDRTPLTPAGSAWLLLSAVLYVVSWLPSVWFWRALMRAFGGRPDFAASARAYYCGALGKYIPGKAMVLVLRGSLMNGRGSAGRTAAITAAYETLTMMGTGLLVGLVLAPLPEGVPGRDQRWLVPVVVLAVLSGLPVIARLLSWAVVKMSPPDLVELDDAAPRDRDAVASRDRLVIPTWLVGAGCAAFLISWALQGLSLGVTLHAVDQPLDWAEWPVWSGAMALSTSLGFAMLFAPAGLGVREGILLGILTQAGVDPHSAIAATVLSRLVSFGSDLLVAGLLYPTFRRRIVEPDPPLAK
jgi:uncharacterized membrane protein YbhN (UPF0104 family)